MKLLKSFNDGWENSLLQNVVYKQNTQVQEKGFYCCYYPLKALAALSRMLLMNETSGFSK